MKLITLDFETYYDQEYSLGAMKYNTSGYVLAPEFQVHCVGIKVDDGPAEWYLPEDVTDVLHSFDWNDCALLCHNTAFDGFILAMHYGIVPAYYYDTLSMTRALHPENSRASLKAISAFYGVGVKDATALTKTKGKRELDEDTLTRLGTYCSMDVDLCYEIFQIQAHRFPQDELDLIDLTIRMFCCPSLEVDEVRAQAALEAEVAEKQALIDSAGAHIDDLMSSNKFAQLLAVQGVAVPEKYSAAQESWIPALAQSDAEFIDLLEHDNIQVVKLVEARLAAKSTIGETRAQRLIDAAKLDCGLPVLLNYYGAKTGRFSGGNKMNLQNLPRGGELRKSIVAPKGHVVWWVDSAQIEARFNAWLADELDLLEAFRRKEDIYSKFASVLYGRPIDRKRQDGVDEHGDPIYPDETEGFIGKVCILGLGYQMGGPKLQTTLARGAMGPPVHITLAEAYGYVNLYRSRYKMIAGNWDGLTDVLEDLCCRKSGVYREKFEYDPGGFLQPNCIWLPNGLALSYPKLRHIEDHDREQFSGYEYTSQGGDRHIYGGKLDENYTQAVSRIAVTEQMLETRRRGHRIATMSHDEIVGIAKESEAEATVKDVVSIMSTSPRWAPTIPLAAEGKFSNRYAK